MTNIVSNFICLEMTRIWNISIQFSSFEMLWVLFVALVLAMTASFMTSLIGFATDFPLVTVAAIFVSSPQSEPKSCCVVSLVFCFHLLFNFFGCNSG